MTDVKAKVDEKIKSKKVMVFSKKFCPYCDTAKTVFKEFLKNGDLKKDEYEVWDIQGERDSAIILRILRQMTGASTVPRVFVNGKFFGGGDETVNKRAKLREMLKADQVIQQTKQ